MITIFWAGDSTVKQNSIVNFPQTGIGQAFTRYIDRERVRVENHAENGRSTKSFIDEGRMAPIYDRITRGDFLFVQFGHNDEKVNDPRRYTDPDTAFQENLEKFVNVARNKGATPVFITPVTRFHLGEAGEDYRHLRWAAAVKAAGARLGVAVIDLTSLSERLVQATGEAARTTFYMNLPARTYPHFPCGQRDNTHLQPAGALAFAGLIARELRSMGGEYAALLCQDFDKYVAEADGASRVDNAAQEVEL
ncbi:MAG: rhamnogalacturonan acetylesterase [Clostridia bacterium]|nr:rhamnogalacturonan acetylesterase [Clostridia bacterium]